MKRWHPKSRESCYTGEKAEPDQLRVTRVAFSSLPLRVVRGAAETGANGPSSSTKLRYAPVTPRLCSLQGRVQAAKLGEWRAKAARRSTPAASSLPRCQDHGRPSDSCFMLWKATTGDRKTFRYSAEPEWHVGCDECSGLVRGAGEREQRRHGSRPVIRTAHATTTTPRSPQLMLHRAAA
jgi:hypothetical protein